jgi:hypothetical protein
VNGTLAITAKGQTVGHVTTTIFTKIKGMLSLVRVLRVSIRNYHLCQRETPENWSNIALVIECDVVQDNTFTVVETNVDAPILPLDSPSLDLE